MPATTLWSRSTPLIWRRSPRSRPARASRVKRGSSGSGPRRAMPGTSAGSRAQYTASRFWVPASVRSKPSPPASRTRRASGPRPGRGGAAGRVSCQRSHPARARWTTRCGPSSVERSRNLPCRRTAVTSRPSTAPSGGSYVLRTLTATGSTRSIVRPTRRSVRNPARASTSGSSGMTPVCRSVAGRQLNADAVARGAAQPTRASQSMR